MTETFRQDTNHPPNPVTSVVYVSYKIYVINLNHSWEIIRAAACVWNTLITNSPAIELFPLTINLWGIQICLHIPPLPINIFKISKGRNKRRILDALMGPSRHRPILSNFLWWQQPVGGNENIKPISAYMNVGGKSE